MANKSQFKKRPRTTESSAVLAELKQPFNDFIVPTKTFDGQSVASPKRQKTNTKHIRSASLCSSAKSGRSIRPASFETFSASAFQSPRDVSRNRKSSSRLSMDSNVSMRPLSRCSGRPSTACSDISRGWSPRDWAALESFLKHNEENYIDDDVIACAFAKQFAWDEAVVRRRLLVLRIRARRKAAEVEVSTIASVDLTMTDTMDIHMPSEPATMDVVKPTVVGDLPKSSKGIFSRLMALVWSH